MSEKDWNKEKKKGAAPSGLFWTIEERAFGMGDEKIAMHRDGDLRLAILSINASPYEKNSHVIEFVPQGSPEESLKILQGLQTITAHNGLVLLVRNALSLAAEAQADGVIFTDADKVAEARKVIGDTPIIAAHYDNVDDVSDDVDLAIFGEALTAGDIAKHKPMDKHTVMSKTSVTNENCGSFVLAGCDFLNASHYINTHKDGAAQAIVNMLYAIDLALDVPAQKH